jgi:hypothetical protein
VLGHNLFVFIKIMGTTTTEELKVQFDNDTADNVEGNFVDRFENGFGVMDSHSLQRSDANCT